MARELKKIAFNIHKTVGICIDDKNANEILQYILDETVISEFIKIKSVILEGLHNKHLFQKVIKYKSVYEIRFTNKGRNDRIYCKVDKTSSKTKYVILVKLFNKKTNHIPKDIHKILKNIDNYEYNL